MDWMHQSPTYTSNTKKMMEMDGVVFQLLTPGEYLALLKKTGFSNIQLHDTTREHANISQENINTILEQEKKIKAKFGEEVYQYSLESWSYQRDAFLTHELQTGIFYAQKNSLPH